MKENVKNKEEKEEATKLEEKPKKKPQSVRRCEVVTRLQDDEGNVFIEEDNIPIIIATHQCIREWAYIIHDQDVNEDGNPVAPHVHIIMRFETPQHFENIADWFSLPVSCVEKIKGRWEDACLYLYHKNAPQKFQYDVEDIIANFDVFKILEKQSDKEQLNETIEKILSGEIREYNKTLLIDQSFLVFHSRLIREAFKVRAEHLRATVKERNTEVYYITGQAGCGKTTLAKQICDAHNLPYFVSSGSNDILDSYSQEPAIICDDIRPSVLGLSDLLKFLDPNTSCSVKSRYFNKFVHAEIIILTSVLGIESFYHNVFENESEPINQLKRRCSTYIEMNRDTISISVWDKKRNRYSAPVVYVNDIIDGYMPDKNVTQSDVKKHVSDIIPFLKEYSFEPSKPTKVEIQRFIDTSNNEIERQAIKEAYADILNEQPSSDRELTIEQKLGIEDYD